MEPDDFLFKKKCRQLDIKGVMYRINHLYWRGRRNCPARIGPGLPEPTRTEHARRSIASSPTAPSVQNIFNGGLYQRETLASSLMRCANNANSNTRFAVLPAIAKRIYSLLLEMQKLPSSSFLPTPWSLTPLSTLGLAQMATSKNSLILMMPYLMHFKLC